MAIGVSFYEMFLDHIKSKCSPVHVEERFAFSLDEMYGHESFFQNLNLTPSRVLKECDPIAFNQGVNDYAGFVGNLIEIDGEHYSRDDIERVKNEIVSEIEAVCEKLH